MIRMASAMMVRDRLMIISGNLVTIAVEVNASLGRRGSDRFGRMRSRARPEDQHNHDGGNEGEQMAHWGRVLTAKFGQGECRLFVQSHRRASLL